MYYDIEVETWMVDGFDRDGLEGQFEERVKYLLKTCLEPETIEEEVAEKETIKAEVKEEETTETEMEIIEEKATVLTVPSFDLTEQVLRNFEALCSTYYYLLNKATGFTELAVNVENIEFRECNLKDVGQTLLVRYMVLAVKVTKVICPKAEAHPENEKFAFRTWLLRLGWKGTE